mgnify:CR=1 FL=1
MTPTTFNSRCKALGIHHRACGPAVRDFLTDLRTTPLRLNTQKDGYAHRTTTHPALGKAVSAGLAALGEDRCFRITPKGEDWLAQLAQHQLS